MSLKNKRIIKSLIISLVLGIITIILVVLLLHNIDKIVKIKYNNEFIKVFFDKLYSLKKKIPIMLIISFTILYFLCAFFLININKPIFIIVEIILLITALSITFLLSSYGDTFVFQIIENLKEGLKNYA